MTGALYGVLLGAITCITLLAVYKLFQSFTSLSPTTNGVLRVLLQAVVIIIAVNFSDYFCSIPAMKIPNYKSNVSGFFLAWAFSGPGAYLILFRMIA
jgi:hypothetical protein